jgi:FixJ family two-component response regulator
VVEDDAVSRRSLGRLLEIGGFEPSLFESAEDFLATPPDPAPVCLILDLQLSGMSGIELQRKLRAEGSTLPIIVTTGNREEAVSESVRRQGCRCILFKPFSSHDLLVLLGTIADEAIH